MTEREIIQGCKKLIPNAQRELVKSYSGLLYTVCRRYCADDFMAKEALQEGLIRIFKSIDSYDEKKGRLNGWMNRIVANESIKLLHKKRKNHTEDIQDFSMYSSAPDALDNLQEEELIRLIQQLPIGYREVFNMYVIDGYSHKEISTILNINESTSRSQLTRAKKLLKQKIAMIENLQLCRKKT